MSVAQHIRVEFKLPRCASRYAMKMQTSTVIPESPACNSTIVASFRNSEVFRLFFLVSAPQRIENLYNENTMILKNSLVSVFKVTRLHPVTPKKKQGIWVVIPPPPSHA